MMRLHIRQHQSADAQSRKEPLLCSGSGPDPDRRRRTVDDPEEEISYVKRESAADRKELPTKACENKEKSVY